MSSAACALISPAKGAPPCGLPMAGLAFLGSFANRLGLITRRIDHWIHKGNAHATLFQGGSKGRKARAPGKAGRHRGKDGGWIDKGAEAQRVIDLAEKVQMVHYKVDMLLRRISDAALASIASADSQATRAAAAAAVIADDDDSSVLGDLTARIEELYEAVSPTLAEAEGRARAMVELEGILAGMGLEGHL